MMSKQLALSIAASVFAMAAFALFGHEGSGHSVDDGGALWSVQVDAPALPELGQLLPTLQ